MKRHVFHLQRSPWEDSIQIYVRQKSSEGRLMVCLPTITWTAYTEEQAYHTAADLQPPLLQLEQADAQRLMDELWHCGLRPSEGSGSAGSLAATQRHLEDMRALVFRSGKPTKEI